MATKPTENNSLVCVGATPRGRPSSYTDEIANEICERIAANELLVEICQEEHMPCIRTVMNWLNKRPEFFCQYERAREAQQHLEQEEIRRIADNAYEDYYIDYKQGPDGQQIPYVVVNNESVRRAQLRIDARKWRAERLAKRFYGANVKHEHSVTPPDATIGEERLPPGLGFLARALSGGQGDAGPVDSGVGEE